MWGERGVGKEFEQANREIILTLSVDSHAGLKVQEVADGCGDVPWGSRASWVK